MNIKTLKDQKLVGHIFQYLGYKSFQVDYFLRCGNYMKTSILYGELPLSRMDHGHIVDDCW